MQKIIILFLILFFSFQEVSQSAVPFTFTNGTVADATEMNANMNYFEGKFSTTSGHIHDGSDSKTLSTLGTITTGTWQGTVIDTLYGGTSHETYASGDLIYATASTGLARLTRGTLGSILVASHETSEVDWLAPGTSGLSLQSLGSGFNPKWASSFKDRGDPSANDFETGDFTTDNTWRDLDLSSIVPAGAGAVLLVIQLTDDVSGSALEFRKNGNTNDSNTAEIRTVVGGVDIMGNVVVALDANRIIEYRGSNLAFNVIIVTIRGWW